MPYILTDMIPAASMPARRAEMCLSKTGRLIALRDKHRHQVYESPIARSVTDTPRLEGKIAAESDHIHQWQSWGE